MVNMILVVIVVVVIAYFVYKNNDSNGSDEQKTEALNALDISSATISSGQALTVADSVYNDLNSWWITSGGNVSDIQSQLSTCQNGSDFNLVCQQFGSRASTISIFPGTSQSITGKMTLTEFLAYKMSVSDYQQTIAPFKGQGGLV